MSRIPPLKSDAELAQLLLQGRYLKIYTVVGPNDDFQKYLTPLFGPTTITKRYRLVENKLLLIILLESLPMIREGVNQLLEHRPRDAMAFLADFFQAKAAESSTIMTTPKK